LSVNNLSFIKERLHREGHDLARVTFDLMAQGTLPYADTSIDLVVLPQVLEHMPDPEGMLDEVARVLRPGGSAVVSTRNAESAYGVLWREEECKAQVPNQGPFTPLPAQDVFAWVAARFEIGEEIGIGVEATADAAIATGDARYSGRIYAVRGRRA